MHLYVFLRGIKHLQERFVNDLAAQYTPYWKKNKKGEFVPVTTVNPETGKTAQSKLQLNVRPMELYEIAFPEKEYDRVMTMINPSVKYKEKYKWIAFLVDKMRGMLGLEACPEYEPVDEIIPVARPKFVSVEAIGVKKDEYDENGMEQL